MYTWLKLLIEITRFHRLPIYLLHGNCGLCIFSLLHWYFADI